MSGQEVVSGPGAIVTHGELPVGYVPPSASVRPPASEALDLAAVRDRIKRAYTEVGEVSAQGAHRRWRMSIPSRPDRDSDLIISAALNDAELLAAEVEQLRAQRDAALALHQPDDEGRCKKCVQSWAHEETEAAPCRTARALGAGQ
ncbi:hypothetical protein [Actinoallomurus iriomotensis]|uniref:Uncharacterized protein n=1 Tax=Actinoallomurus iriomotensis TaxID=478107 RepID=A0A9W6RXV4_9ACTN|nr:hypothetical protein [Actinoallomurus iriomotensis]GLY81865.1 hypothetical protein Airi01_101320 [Actinoallomurus iriomotensis]